MKIYGIFTGHNDFPSGVINAVQSILGEQEDYTIVSNLGKDNELISKNLEKIIIDKQDSFEHIFIFIDFYGSSFSIPVLTLSKKYDNITLIFGYNLPIALDFFIHREKKDQKQLYEKLIQIGKSAIK